MQIITLGAAKWTVYAVCTDETTCVLLDFVAELDLKRGRKVLSDLQSYVPNSDPSDWVRADFSWQLRGSESILEFRWSKKGGGTPRVYWFYDEGRVIVCSHGDNKKGATDEDDIRAAERTRAAYFAAKTRGDLTIVGHQEFTSCGLDDPDKD